MLLHNPLNCLSINAIVLVNNQNNWVDGEPIKRGYEEYITYIQLLLIVKCFKNTSRIFFKAFKNYLFIKTWTFFSIIFRPSIKIYSWITRKIFTISKTKTLFPPLLKSILWKCKERENCTCSDNHHHWLKKEGHLFHYFFDWL